MGTLTLVTGGCRSGKSRYAQHAAERLAGRRLFLATAPVLDAEMAQRVERHREMRRGRGWETLEETMAVADALRRADGFDVVLCDCLTLWVNNLLYTAALANRELEEDEMARLAREVCAAARAGNAQVFLVSNEVGLGIVPGDALSRRFRDLAGRCNQEVAAAADSVVMLISGIPMHIKAKAQEIPLGKPSEQGFLQTAS